MQGLDKVVRLFMLLMFVFFLFTFYFHHISKNRDGEPPDATVKKFSKCYGAPCMDDIGELTLPKFRDFKPKSVWVADTWKALRELEYKKLKARIAGARVEKGNAMVSMESTVRTINGTVEQTEVYYLVKKNEKWLIQDRTISDGKVDLNALNF